MKDFLWGEHPLDKFSRAWFAALLLAVAIGCGSFAVYGIMSSDRIVRSSAMQLLLVYAALFSAASFLITRHLLKAVLFHIAITAIAMGAVYFLAVHGMINLAAASMYMISTAENGAFGIFLLLIAIFIVLLFRGCICAFDAIERRYPRRRQPA